MFAFVTGASSGIGEIYVRQLVLRRQKPVIITARRHERLVSLADELRRECFNKNIEAPIIHCIQGDLSSRASRNTLLAEIDALGVEVDLVINNAGFGSLGSFLKSSVDWELDMIEVNCATIVHFSHHFGAKMVQQKRGTIVNVASTASYQPMPMMATYAATKSFVVSFSMALAEEFRRSNVHIMAHCPGPTESEFHKVVGLEDKLTHIPGMRAEPVVKAALKAMRRKKKIYINGWLNWTVAMLASHAPKWLSSRLVRFVLRAHV